ncbi:GGDEF domain-containing protein [Aliikangiella sp. G2MR2-5]|uniref:diguanylate cyclase n=1 Tax=Aliikangiella sp. G2MR2-5 TaxID=2788943 RepID=UPI0018AC48E7
MNQVPTIARILFVLLFGTLFALPTQASPDKKRVLVLHSYHQGFHWTDRIMAGINEVLTEQDNIELFVNYMDTKRRSDTEYFRLLKKLYFQKYQLFKFDLIISSDDHALDFLLKYRDELFPDTPVVFSGLNDYYPGRLNSQNNFTGIYESYDVLGTLELMRSLHPQTEKIWAITDNTRSGNIFKSLIEDAEKSFSANVQIEYLHDLPELELVKKLETLPENSLVLWAIYLRMHSGTTLSSKESVRLVSNHSRFPTYCIWDVVGQGVVGGKITSPNFQGEMAAKIGLQIINGKAIEQIAVKGSPLVNIFDYRVLQKFEISMEKIPENSIVLNRPESLYEKYKRYFVLYGLFTLLLLLTIFFLVAVIFLKRKNAEFEGKAMHDPLTGLYNRYYLDEVVCQKFSESVRHQSALSLMLLDIDHFKKVNDTYGHLTGDVVLKQVAQLLSKNSRSEDIVTRIGGEEFVIILDHCDLNKACEKAEQLRKDVETLKPANIDTTISIGVSQLKPLGETLNQLLARADKAVYQAKKSGRNRICAA